MSVLKNTLESLAALIKADCNKGGRLVGVPKIPMEQPQGTRSMEVRCHERKADDARTSRVPLRRGIDVAVPPKEIVAGAACREGFGELRRRDRWAAYRTFRPSR
jgi:hypothetical protein